MSNSLKYKNGVFCGRMTHFKAGKFNGTHEIEIVIKNGSVAHIDFLDAAEDTERVGGDKLPNNNGGEINWLFVFGVGFLAIAAFHLFVK